MNLRKSKRKPIAARAMVSNQVLMKCAASFNQLGNATKLFKIQISKNLKHTKEYATIVLFYDGCGLILLRHHSFENQTTTTNKMIRAILNSMAYLTISASSKLAPATTCPTDCSVPPNSALFVKHPNQTTPDQETAKSTSSLFLTN